MILGYHVSLIQKNKGNLHDSDSLHCIPLPTNICHTQKPAQHLFPATNIDTMINTQNPEAIPIHSAEIQLVLSTTLDSNDLLSTQPSPPTTLPELHTDTPVIEPLSNTNHPMLTRSMHGIIKPNPKYALTITISLTIPYEPRNFKAALSLSGWKAAMEEELMALHKNETWKLVPRTHDMHVIGSKWVFKSKLKPNGTLDRLKAQLVAKGYHQIDGIDYIETFSLVIKPGTIRMILTIALVRHWPIRQLDVKNAFLHGTIIEDIYIYGTTTRYD